MSVYSVAALAGDWVGWGWHDAYYIAGCHRELTPNKSHSVFPPGPHSYQRAEVLGGFINGLFLVFISFFIFKEALEVRVQTRTLLCRHLRLESFSRHRVRSSPGPFSNFAAFLQLLPLSLPVFTHFPCSLTLPPFSLPPPLTLNSGSLTRRMFTVTG